MHTALVCDTDSGIQETLAAVLHAHWPASWLCKKQPDAAMQDLKLLFHPTWFTISNDDAARDAWS